MDQEEYDYGEEEVSVKAKDNQSADHNFQNRYELAKKRVEEIREFYVHLAVFVCINAFLFLLDIVQGDGIDFAYYVTIFWGIGLVMHFGTLFGESIFLGRDWEARKIRQLMGEDEKPKRRG